MNGNNVAQPNKNNDVLKQIQKGNSWYVGSQLKQITNKATKEVIYRRWRFIISSLEEFIKEGKNKKLKILDAGCGDGINLHVLVDIPDVEFYGIDYNALRLARVKEKFPEVKVLEGNLVSMNFDKTFDVILCCQALEHIKEDQKVLQNLYNLLEDGGILILGVPNEGCLFAKVRNKIIEPYISKTTDHVNFYTEKMIRQKVTNAGFIIKSVMYENFFVPYQRLHSWLVSRDWGFRILNKFGEIFKSQAGGFYFTCKKE